MKSLITIKKKQGSAENLHLVYCFLKPRRPSVRWNREKLSEAHTAKTLPQLPQKRSKPEWASTNPLFILRGDPSRSLFKR